MLRGGRYGRGLASDDGAMHRFLLALVAVVAVALAGCSSTTRAPARRQRPTTTTTAQAPTTSAPPARPTTALWPTYGRDGARSGYDPTVAPITRPAETWSANLGATAYAQPLVVGNRVVVATEDDTVLAFDAGTGRRLWQATLGKPVPGSSLPCGDINPSGITGTPVIDTADGVIWAVAFVQPGRHELDAVDLATGAIRSRRSVDPPGSSPLVEQQRGALALSGGRVYVPFGGLFGDCGDYHGYVAALDETGSRAPLVYRVAAPHQAGIWAPGGPSVGPAGVLYVATGNGSPPGSGGDQVVALSPGLSAVGSWEPANAAQLDSTDADLGSTGPVAVGAGRLFQVGKAGVGHLLDASRLSASSAEIFSAPVCKAAFGADAVLPGSGGSSTVLVPCTDGLVALRVGAGPSFSVIWKDAAITPGGPVVAGGAVWAQDPKAGTLVALDPATGHQLASLTVGPGTRFAAPSAGATKVYAVAGSKLVAVAGA